MITDSGVPDGLRYTASHEWLRRDGASPVEATIGITDFAQDQLGDVVYVELPAPGARLSAGEVCGEIESTKTVAELYAPVDGELTAVNDELNDAPELVNASPYGDGWLLRVRIADDADLGGLLDADAYRAHLQDS